jgi:two-component SAPR family response regulator
MAKIMVISQDLELIEKTATSLKNEGHEVVSCSKPAEVLYRTRGKDLDLVFIDVHMRDVQHEKVAEVVRRVVPDAEIVSITSYAFPYVSADDVSHVTSYLVQP